MNRFFRSAFFPLIVIVLLVWLASQTLIKQGNHTKTLKYSQLYDAVKSEPSSHWQAFTFNPSRREITAKVASDEKTQYRVHYASDQAQIQFQNALQDKDVKFDSKGVGGFSWTALLGSFL